MARFGKQSRLGPDRVLAEAERFFGTGGLGMEPGEQQPGLRAFRSGGGSVVVRAVSKGRGSDVDIESRQWDKAIPDCLEKI